MADLVGPTWPLRMPLEAHLVDDRVLFGLLRLSFGPAAYGRLGALGFGGAPRVSRFIIGKS